VAGCKESPWGPCRSAWKAAAHSANSTSPSPDDAICPLVDGRCDGRTPSPTCGGGSGRGPRRRHAFRPFEKPRHFPFPAHPGKPGRGRSPPRIDAEGVLDAWRYRWISILHGVVPPKIVRVKKSRGWGRSHRPPRQQEGAAFLCRRRFRASPAAAPPAGLAPPRRFPQKRGHDPSALRRGPGAARGGAAGEPGAAQGPSASAAGGRPGPAPGRRRAGAAGAPPIAASRRPAGT